MIHISRNFLALSTSLLIGALYGTGLRAQPIVISDLVEGHAIVEPSTSEAAQSSCAMTKASWRRSWSVRRSAIFLKCIRETMCSSACTAPLHLK